MFNIFIPIDRDETLLSKNPTLFLLTDVKLSSIFGHNFVESANRFSQVMKILIKKEFDGQMYIGSCENIPNCYVQSLNPDDLTNKLKKALLILKRHCEDRHLAFPLGHDRPLLNLKIRFDQLSTEHIIKIFERNNYHQVYFDEDSVLLMNSEFPFNRVHLPRTAQLSPLLVRKLFGENNAIQVIKNKMKLSSSAF